MNGTANAATTLKVIRQFHDLQRSHPGLTTNVAAEYAGVTDSTIRSYMNERFRSPRLDSKLGELLARVDAGEVSLFAHPPGALTVDDIYKDPPARRIVRSGTRNFHDLEMTRKVWTALDYCHEEAQIGLIHATFRAGKTFAIKEWIKSHRVNALHFEFKSFLTSNRVVFIRTLARRLGIEEKSIAGTGDRVYEAVVEHLCQVPTFLIFDQAEGAREPVLQIIRHIWDDTHDKGVGVALLGANVLYERLKASTGREVGALTKRITLWAGLTGITKGEMVAVLKKEGITDIDGPAIDLMWRGVAGATGVLFAAIEMLNAKHKGKAVREKDVQRLIQMLHGVGGAW